MELLKKEQKIPCKRKNIYKNPSKNRSFPGNITITYPIKKVTILSRWSSQFSSRLVGYSTHPSQEDIFLGLELPRDHLPALVHMSILLRLRTKDQETRKAVFGKKEAFGLVLGEWKSILKSWMLGIHSRFLFGACKRQYFQVLLLLLVSRRVLPWISDWWRLASHSHAPYYIGHLLLGVASRCPPQRQGWSGWISIALEEKSNQHLVP